jgi:polyhydroxyalkanoate synthesis repressor PhaR
MTSQGSATQPSGKKEETVIIKKYANRRLYNTATSIYVTLDDLYDLVKEGSEFQVLDARTGEDITHSVLIQIIFDRESKGQHGMLPANFLKELIKMYDGSVQQFVPHYLEASMQMFADNQERLKEMFSRHGFNPMAGGVQQGFKEFANFNPFQMFEGVARQNMELFHSSMEMFLGNFNRKDK